MKQGTLYKKIFLFFFLGFLLLPVLVLSVNRETNYTANTQAQPSSVGCNSLTLVYPFVEYFHSASPTKDCWTIVNRDRDDIAWKIDATFGHVGGYEIAHPGTANISLNANNQELDDWLISPTITLTGHQRLRFLYALRGPDIIHPDPLLAVKFGVHLSTEGTNPANFTHTLVANTRYNYTTSFIEVVVDLKDQEGNPFVGDVNIGLHLTNSYYLFNEARLLIDNVVVENIHHQISPTPVNLPYFTNFDDAPPFEYIQDDVTMWHIGGAVQNGSNNALYISNDGGNTHAFTPTTQASLAYIDINLPPGSQELVLDFDYIQEAPGFFNIYLTSTSSLIIPRVPSYSRLTNRYQPVPLQDKVLTSEFKHLQTYINVISARAFFGQPVRLVFEWYNTDQTPPGLPIALDNLAISYRNCSSHFLTGTVPLPSISDPSEMPKLIPTEITHNSANLTIINDTLVHSRHYDFIVSPAILELESLDDTTIPTYSHVTSSFTATNLTPLTNYYLYVRVSCDANNKGRWLGYQPNQPPSSVLNINAYNFRTRQTPAPAPFSDDFEGDFNWDYDSPNRITEGVNYDYQRWYRGTAANHTGTQALYISEDQGETYSYNRTSITNSFAFVYRDIFIPTGVSEIKVSYDYQVGGEIRGNTPLDYFKLIVSPLDQIELTPVEERRLRQDFLLEDNGWKHSSNNFTLGEPHYVHTAGWQTESVVLNVQNYQGELLRFAFLWNVLNNTGGLQPPAAIDNFNIEVNSCTGPTDLQADFVSDSNSALLSWTPQGEATQWEVFITELGEDAPTENTQGILVQNDPALLVENLAEGTYYTYYVRAICEGNTINNKGFWIGPKKYGYFNVPICMEIEEIDIDLPQNDTGQYIICGGQPYTQTLTADYFIDRKTDDYIIEEIAFEPPFPYFGNDSTEITTTNTWSSIIDLGFDFCFYDNTYNKVLVSPNSAITFSITGVADQGRYTPNSNTNLLFNQPIPNESTGTQAPFVNAILGAMQALDPNASPTDHSINYNVYGEAPCRAFVFNVYHLAMTGTTPNNALLDETTQTTQIVLYEGTNIIEVYVKNSPFIQVENPHNNAQSVLGIQNADGTQARSPYQRNTGAWSAYEEAWRFVPNGAATVDFKWYKNGVAYSTEKEIEVTLNQEDTYTARAVYTTCSAEERIIERVYDFIRDDFQVPELPNYYQCSDSTDPNEAIQMDLTQHKTILLALLQAEEGTTLEIECFQDEALTQPLEETIQVQDRQTVYVKVTNPLTTCYKVADFQAIRRLPIALTQLNDVEACSTYILPDLQENEAYFTQPKGQGKQYNSGDTYDQPGTSTLYIYLVDSEHDCIAESRFTLLLQERISAMPIPDQRLECEIFILPELPAGQHYYTKPNAEGIELLPGSPVIEPATIYVYTKVGADHIQCTDEHSFRIDFLDCPMPKGFSPNGDGQNDSFDLTNYGISNLKVFNRNGTEVYTHGKGYTNQWTGKDKSGNKLPTGTYYYSVIANGKQKTGWVYVNY